MGWHCIGENAMSMGSGSPLNALVFNLCLYYSCFSLSPGPCHPNPCHNNGECQLVPNRGDVFTDYICKCPAGYDGVHCQNSEYSRGAGRESLGAPRVRTGRLCSCDCVGHQAVSGITGCFGACRVEGRTMVWGQVMSEPCSASLEGLGASSNNTRGASRLSLLCAGSQP